jgi:[ribosomal protein S5]-alanine N-acetyltransferase
MGHASKTMKLETQRLILVLQTREDVEQMIAAMPEADRAQISAAWLDNMRAARAGDPWSFAFRVLHRGSGAVVGTCSYKGPPVDGVVEIAYAINPDQQRQGYATEAAHALFDYAAACGEARLVRAHTLPDAPASKRVLAKCGFRYVGETVDPDDGPVSRFERAT